MLGLKADHVSTRGPRQYVMYLQYYHRPEVCKPLAVSLEIGEIAPQTAYNGRQVYTTSLDISLLNME